MHLLKNLSIGSNFKVFEPNFKADNYRQKPAIQT